MKETTPSDRVQLIDRGSLMHPGCCALCGSGNCDEGYVDTGVWYDYEGQVYFCWNCCMQIAAVVGCLSADEHSQIRELLEDTARELKAVKAELETANEQLGQYDAIMLRAISGSPDGVILPSGSPVEAQPADAEATDQPNDLPVGQSDEGESVLKEPVKGSGRRKPPRTQRSDSSTDESGITI